MTQQLKEKADKINAENKELVSQQQLIRDRAIEARDNFVSDISQVLSESRNIKNLRTKSKELQRRLHLAESYESELKECRKRVKDLERGQWNKAAIMTGPSIIPKSRNILQHAEDKLLLHMFAYLETVDVLSSAQVFSVLISPTILLLLHYLWPLASCCRFLVMYSREWTPYSVLSPRWPRLSGLSPPLPLQLPPRPPYLIRPLHPFPNQLLLLC
jgi:small-conductance mechanosensitive channel